MNASDKSLEDGASVVTKVFPSIPLSFLAISTGFTVEEDLEETCHARSVQRYLRVKGLILNFQVVYPPMEG